MLKSFPLNSICLLPAHQLSCNALKQTIVNDIFFIYTVSVTPFFECGYCRPFILIVFLDRIPEHPRSLRVNYLFQPENMHAKEKEKETERRKHNNQNVVSSGFKPTTASIDDWLHNLRVLRVSLTNRICDHHFFYILYILQKTYFEVHTKINNVKIY